MSKYCFVFNFGLVLVNMNGIRTNIETYNLRLCSYSINYYSYRKFCDVHILVNQINSNHKRIKKTRVANAFLENRSRDLWSEISKMRRKTHRTMCIVEGFSNN